MTREVQFFVPQKFLREMEGVFTDEHLEALKGKLGLRPQLGALIPGTGGARKIWQLGERGQSRVIYYYHPGTSEVVFLSCYAKNQKADLTKAEKDIARAIIKTIKDARKVK